MDDEFDDFVAVLDAEIDGIIEGNYIHVIGETTDDYIAKWYTNCGAYNMIVSKEACHKINNHPDTLFYRAISYDKRRTSL